MPETPQPKTRSTYRRPIRYLIIAAVVLGLLVAIVLFGSLSANVATAVGAAIVLGIGGLGVWLLLAYPDTGWVEVGKGLVMGSIVSLAVGTGQYALEQKRKERENQQARRQDQRESQRALRLTLGLSRDLRGVDLEDRALDGFLLAGKDLSGARLARARLVESSLVDSNLEGADLRDADLRSAKLTGANLKGANLTGANLSRAHLFRAQLTQAELAGANLERASLDGASLQNACLVRANLAGAHLPGANLTGALLVRARLTGAVFEVDQRSATLDGTGLVGAIIDAKTHWPPGDATEMMMRIAGRASPKIPRGDREPPPSAAPVARTVSVGDGDSIELDEVGHVRLLGLNAPDGKKPLGIAATAFLKTQLPAGTEVRYAYDATRTDQLGRRLLYVWLPDGRFLNELLVEQGYAARMDFPGNRRYVSRLRKAELRARVAGRNIWRDCQSKAFFG